MSVAGAGRKIAETVGSWDGVTQAPHRFGGTEFRIGRREVGHVHGDRLVDIPFPRAVRDEVIGKRAAVPHHILPQSGWVSVYLEEPNDVDGAIELLRKSYEMARRAQTHTTRTG